MKAFAFLLLISFAFVAADFDYQGEFLESIFFFLKLNFNLVWQYDFLNIFFFSDDSEDEGSGRLTVMKLFIYCILIGCS